MFRNYFDVLPNEQTRMVRTKNLNGRSSEHAVAGTTGWIFARISTRIVFLIFQFSPTYQNVLYLTVLTGLCKNVQNVLYWTYTKSQQNS